MEASAVTELLSAGSLQHLIHAYGLWILFAVVMVESMGVPMPGETVLITAAIYAGSTQQIDILSVIAVAAAAAVIGDNIGYLVGRSVGLPLLNAYGRYIHLDAGRLAIGQYLFRTHGGKIVFFGRFIAFLRAFAAMLAGANRMSWPRFLLMNALGGICWATLFGSGAYLFGESIEHVAGPVGLVLLLLAVAMGIAGIRFFRRNEKELEARALRAMETEQRLH
jgi:membrane protein DedA with SNARE-associated domain